MQASSANQPLKYLSLAVGTTLGASNATPGLTTTLSTVHTKFIISFDKTSHCVCPQ